MAQFISMWRRLGTGNTQGCRVTVSTPVRFRSKNSPSHACVSHRLVFGCVFAHERGKCCLQMVVDTLLLCFCEDCELNDGTPGKQYFMSQSLMVSQISC